MPIALLTDFGTKDHFVGAMKGVILGINPNAAIVDITHEVAPHDIRSAAFLLLCCYRDFPPGTIFVVVVDPGVGSERRAIAVEAGGYFFVGPDNGVFSYVLEREVKGIARELTNKAYRRPSVSTTFHGRDVFAPAAAHISKNTAFSDLGPEAADLATLPSSLPLRDAAVTIRGEVVHVDRFGNLITNLRPEDLGKRFRLQIGTHSVDRVFSHFAEGPEGTPFLIEGSTGFMEIAVRNGSASELLQINSGDAAILHLDI
jgi:S-adenosylmethionine hydrolase